MTTSQKHQLHVSDRMEVGKKLSNLRKNGLIPANIFGGSQPSQAITLKNSDLRRFINDVGESTLVYLSFDATNTEVPTLIDEVQRDPVSSEFNHVAFKRVKLDEKVTAEVPVELIGEANIRDANVLLVKDVLEVEALPADLPEKITLDVSVLTEVGQTLTLKNAQYDATKVSVLLSEEEMLEPLVIVQGQVEEVEEEVVEPLAEGDAAAEAGAATTPEGTESQDKATDEKK